MAVLANIVSSTRANLSKTWNARQPNIKANSFGKLSTIFLPQSEISHPPITRLCAIMSSDSDSPICGRRETSIFSLFIKNFLFVSTPLSRLDESGKIYLSSIPCGHCHRHPCARPGTVEKFMNFIDITFINCQQWLFSRKSFERVNGKPPESVCVVKLLLSSSPTDERCLRQRLQCLIKHHSLDIVS